MHQSDLDERELGSRVGRLIAAHRAARGLTQAELATRSELSRTILSRIEQGDGNPSISTLWRLSRALHLPLSELLVEPTSPRTRVVRAGGGERIDDPSGMVARLVHATAGERRTELFVLDLPAGTVRESGAHLAGVEEVDFVMSGRVSIGPDGAAEALGSGDAIWFAADLPHRYEVLEGASRVLCWMLYPSGVGQR